MAVTFHYALVFPLLFASLFCSWLSCYPELGDDKSPRYSLLGNNIMPPPESGLEAFYSSTSPTRRLAAIQAREERSRRQECFSSSFSQAEIFIKTLASPIKFPCGICSKPVKINQRGICCDSCDRWYHTRCCLIGDHMYDILANSSCLWICCDCGLPNFSDLLFNSSMESNLNNNSFSSLSSIDSNLLDHFTPNSKCDYISSRRGRKQNLRKLKVLNLNCSSIKSQQKVASSKLRSRTRNHISFQELSLNLMSQSKTLRSSPATTMYFVNIESMPILEVGFLSLCMILLLQYVKPNLIVK